MILRIPSYMVGYIIDSINATHLCFYNKYEIDKFSINFLNNIIKIVSVQLNLYQIIIVCIFVFILYMRIYIKCTVYMHWYISYMYISNI